MSVLLVLLLVALCGCAFAAGRATRSRAERRADRLLERKARLLDELALDAAAHVAHGELFAQLALQRVTALNADNDTTHHNTRRGIR